MKKLFLIIIFLLSQFIYLSAQEASVVCLHGFFRSYKCLIPLGNMLRDEGYHVLLWDYNGRRKTIEELAASLVPILNTIAQDRPGQPIHFVTHSLGGIIVRAAVNHPDCPYEAKIGKAILLAPPNKGASLAHQFQDSVFANWLLGKKAGRQILNYGQVEMDALGQFPETKEVLVIAGYKGSRFFGRWMKEPNDGKVTVHETYLSTPHWHHTTYVSHSWIMTSRYTLSVIRSFLRAPKYYTDQNVEADYEYSTP